MRHNELVTERIRKISGGYRLYSHNGKNLGTFKTRAAAEKHERQVQYFKHMGEEINPKVFRRGFEQSEKFGDYTIIATPGRFLLHQKYNDPSEQFTVRALLGKDKVAWVNFELIDDHLEALDLYVDPKHRRKGIATAMYQFAKKLGNDIIPSSKQTGMGKQFWATKSPVTEAFDKPNQLDWDKDDFENHHAFSLLGDGSPLHIKFELSDREGNGWHVVFNRNFKYLITGQGLQQQVFATVLAAVKQFVEKYKPGFIEFSANKDVETGQKSQSRANLYNSLVNRYARAWGYQAHIDDQEDEVVYKLTRINQSVSESNNTPTSGKTDLGYTWKFEPGREVPFKTDVDANTFIRVTDPTGKTVAGVWADVAGDSLVVEYSQVFDEELRGRGLYTDLLKSLSKQYNVTSDTDTNNAAAGIYRRLGADYDAGQARHTLRKKGVAEAVAPDQKLQSSVLYHGTPTKAGYQGISSQGLKIDPELIAQKYKGQENFAPLPGVYMTKEFGNAVRYSFMSNVPDEQYAEYIKQEPNGYVFEFSGKNLATVTPDEDELGGLLRQLVNTKNLQPNLLKIVQAVPEELRVKLQQPNVNFETIAIAGKWLINRISDSTIQYLMKRYHNVVNYGGIKPSAVWVIPKPNERFLRDRQGTFNTHNGYVNYAKRFGKKYNLTNDKQGVAEGTLNEFDYNKHVKMLKTYMKKLGYSYVGHGTDAHVFAKEEGSVIKVLIPRSGDISTAKNPFLAFLNYCTKNAGNPHLPKFIETTKQPIQLGSEKFDQVVMERLQEVDPEYENMLVSMVDGIEDGKPLDPQYQPYIKFYQTLKSVMLTGRKLGFENDIITFQSVNIMQRGDTLVIIDPWTGSGRLAEGSEIRIDVPNEEWLQDKREYAKEKGRNSFGVPYMGTTTAYTLSDVKLPVDILKRIPGMRGEQQRVRQQDLDAIMTIMRDTGRLPIQWGKEYAPFINVAWNGEAWVNEGNHRIMAAAALGWKDMPVQISYFDGGERVKSGTMYPGRIGLGNQQEITNEDYDPNGPPPGPETKPTMPQGTVRVEVSDLYDWYKLGQNISNLDRVDPKIFGKGPPSTIMAFGSEEEEHKYITALMNLGLDTVDIDPVDPNQPKGMPRQKVDPTYNVTEDSSTQFAGKTSEKPTLIQAFGDFLPFVMRELNIAQLPAIKLKKEVPAGDQPTFGKFDSRKNCIYLGIINRHVIDILRTLAHELVHYQQNIKHRLDANSGKTGSGEENQANAVAGVIMRNFNKQYPKYFHTPIIENFDDGKKPGRKGLSQRVGIPKNATIAQLERYKDAPGEKGRMARWQLNMRRGQKNESSEPNTNSIVIRAYRPIVDEIKPGPVDNYVDQARELLVKTDSVNLRKKLIDVFKKGRDNPYIQGGIITTVGALLSGGVLSNASSLGLSPAQTNIILTAAMNTVIPTVVAVLNGKSWRDTVKYTLTSAGVGTGIAALGEEENK